MARNPIITDEIKGRIGEFYSRHPNWKAKDIQHRVSQLLRKDNPELPQNYPGLSAIQKVLATIRKREKELVDSSEDKPWTLDNLRGNSLPHEVLPKVFSIWLKKQEEAVSPPLSIREARWIAQLSSMTDDIELLQRMAEWCAEWELIGELTETAQLSPPGNVFYIYSQLVGMDDKEWKKHYQKVVTEKHVSGTRHGMAEEPLRDIAIWEMGEKYGADPVKLKDLNLSIEETEKIAKSGKYQKEVNQNERAHTQQRKP